MKSNNDIENELPFEVTTLNGYSEIFKRLYYHLYTNGKSSRAESIIEDLSKILLIELASKNDNVRALVKEFIDKDKEANDWLLPEFESLYPGLANSLDIFTLDNKSIKDCFRELDKLDIGIHLLILLEMLFSFDWAHFKR